MGAEQVGIHSVRHPRSDALLLVRLMYHVPCTQTNVSTRSPMGVLRRSLHASIANGERLMVIDFEPSLARLIKESKGAGFQLVRNAERWQQQEGLCGTLRARSNPN